MSDVSGANIRLGATADGAISELERLRARFALFSREVNTNVTQSFRAAQDAQAEYRKGLIQLGDKLTDIGKKLMLFVSLPALFVGQQAYKDYANVQRLERGLAQYGETLEKVRRLAKEPNIGVFDGAKALIGLRAARIEAGLAERAVRSFANAITLGGGNSADLEPALFNLKQFKATQHINQVDLRQLANRIPQTMEALERAFGTTDTAALNSLGIDKFLEGFITELEKLPKVAGGASVAMEQLSDSATFFSAAFGEGLDKTFGISDKISRLGGFLDNLTTNFKALNPEAQKSVVWFTSLSVVIPVLLTTIGGLIRGWAALAAAAKVGITAMTIPQLFLVGSVIAGIGLAIGGAVAAYKLLTNETAEYKRQQEEVNNLAPKIEPLLTKYDDLKKNVGDSAEKQKELKTVIAQIAELVPSAVTQWDSYGRAIDINKDKVRGFSEEMKKALALMAPMRRNALTTEMQGNRNRASELERQLREGTKSVTIDVGRGVYTQQNVKMSYNELKQAAQELQTIRGVIVEQSKELVSLGGQNELVKARKRLQDLQELQLSQNKQLNEIRARRDKGSYEERKKAEIELLKVRGEFDRQNRAITGRSDLGKYIEEEQKKLIPAIQQWNAAKKDVRDTIIKNAAKPVISISDTKLSTLSVADLEDRIKTLTESYEKLSPAQKDYAEQKAQLIAQIKEAKTQYDRLKQPLDEVTKKSKEKNTVTKTMTELERKLYLIDLEKKHLEQAAAVKRETKEYKELIGVISNYNLKALESRDVLVGNLKGVRLRGTYSPYSYDSTPRYGIQGILGAEPTTLASLAQQAKMNTPVVTAAHYKSNDEKLRAIADSGTKGYLKNLKSEVVERDELAKAFEQIKKKSGESDEDYKARVQSIVKANQELTQSIRSAAAETGVAIGELFGNLINGENPLESFKTRVLMTLGSLLKELGKSLMALSLAGEALQFFRDKPALAFAAGIALSAAGQAASNAAQKKVNATRFAKGGWAAREIPAVIGDNPGARFDPEIVAPYSKVHNSLRQSIKEFSGGMDQTGEIIAETIIRGNDLALVVRRSEAANKGLRASHKG